MMRFDEAKLNGPEMKAANTFGDQRKPASAGVRRSLRSGRISFRLDNRGATAVEFSIVIIPFLMFLSAIIEIGHLYYSAQMLQIAADSIGRPVRTSTLAAGTTIGALIEERLCSRTGGMLRGSFQCDKIRVDIRSPADWRSANMANDYNGMDQTRVSVIAPPGPGQIAIVRVGYPLPEFLNFNFFPGATTDAGGRTVRMISGVAAFRVEPR